MYQRVLCFAKAQFSAFAGGVCDYMIMLFLTEYAGFHYAASIAAGCTAGAAINFSLNKSWAFFSKESKYRFSLLQQMLRFSFVAASSISLKIAGTSLLVVFAEIDYKISRIITDIVVSLCYNYVLQRYWIFRN
ncbi:MAG: GtrA family protein [Prevotellaceae bacterium]|jgi:putative flippase GtrA|nr:GtrA family protein [Prevotellaceae bacterium]